jgi:hypothetical protein
MPKQRATSAGRRDTYDRAVLTPGRTRDWIPANPVVATPVGIIPLGVEVNAVEEAEASEMGVTVTPDLALTDPPAMQYHLGWSPR